MGLPEIEGSAYPATVSRAIQAYFGRDEGRVWTAAELAETPARTTREVALGSAPWLAPRSTGNMLDVGG